MRKGDRAREVETEDGDRPLDTQGDLETDLESDVEVDLEEDPHGTLEGDVKMALEADLKRDPVGDFEGDLKFADTGDKDVGDCRVTWSSGGDWPARCSALLAVSESALVGDLEYDL